MAIPSRGQRVRGYPAPRELPVAIEWGLAYEALVGLSLFIGGEKESTYEVGERWFRAVRRKASTKLKEAGRNLAGKHGYVLVALAGLIRESRARNVDDFVAAVRREGA